ncbi:MAG: hypothetical protein HY879_14145 [Deltaproteobacteria bacterium]|nr:hypothetical protein [Deltaproteobacteria bacterium]
MTIIIVGIISIIVGPILIQGFNSFFASAGVTDMDAQGKLAMERMARDIRGISSPNNIATMASTNFSYWASFSNRFSYYQTGTQLFRDSPYLTFLTHANLLTTNVSVVSPLTFTYLQKDLVTPATGPANVWVVQFQFTLNYAGGGFVANKTFRTSVFLRNAQ